MADAEEKAKAEKLAAAKKRVCMMQGTLNHISSLRPQVYANTFTGGSTEKEDTKENNI